MLLEKKLSSCEIGVIDSDDESGSEDENEIEFNMLRYHAQKIESDIDKCLMTRIKDEAEFAIMKELEKEIMRICDQEFGEQFSKEVLQ